MQIAIALYDGFTALDAIGPYQVLSNMPGAEVVLCAEKAGRIADDNDILHLEVERTFTDVPAPEILLVPGGFITRKLAEERGAIVEWVRSAHETTTWTTSVCTGALVLGAAGLLDGLPATTHWSAYEHLASYGAIPTEQRVVIDGKIATAAGVSAGIDLALTLAGKIVGDDIAEAIQLGIEYDPQPPYDRGSPSKARPEIKALVEGVSRAAEERLQG